TGAEDDPDPTRLQAVLKNTPETLYAGPDIKAELVLEPERIPVLLPGRLDGNLSGELPPGDKSKLVLNAEHLQIVPAKVTTGWVYLTVDAYKPASLYRVTFDPSKKRPGAPETPNKPVLRLIPPGTIIKDRTSVAKSDQPLQIKLEVDGTTANDIVEVS